MKLQDLNSKTSEDVKAVLFQCCGSNKWVDHVIKHIPFSSESELVTTATNAWYNDCDESDWKEAFSHHPKIGVKSLAEKFNNTKHLATVEQSGVDHSNTEVIQQLADANEAYEQKNGFLFIVCATGKSAQEMLRLLQNRLINTTEEEVHIAKGEQQKITILRLKKLLPDADWSDYNGCQLTTHVLDTSLGKPGQDLAIRLQEKNEDRWQTIAQGVTNSDGRIPDLLPPGRILPAQNYRMVFDTGDYFKRNAVKGFYPEVEIQFTVWDDTHYHVPLLINPYGYSTYRGS